MSGKRRDPREPGIGKRVRAFRLERRYSQSKLAQILGVAFQQVQKYENGTNRISASRLHRIAEIFEVPIAVFHSDGARPAGDKADTVESGLEFLTSSGSLRLIQAYARIKDTKVRAALVVLAEQLTPQGAGEEASVKSKFINDINYLSSK